jgi:hypothetical protein
MIYILDTHKKAHKGPAGWENLNLPSKTTKPAQNQAGFAFPSFTQGEALKNTRTAVQPPPNGV